MKKLILAGLAVSTISTSFLGVMQPIRAMEDSIIQSKEVRKPITDWVFKEINGRLYRRLYDYTNDKWLTDWILC